MSFDLHLTTKFQYLQHDKCWPASLSLHAQVFSLGFTSTQLLSTWIKTQAQTRLFLSNSSSTAWPRVSSASCCQFSILWARRFPLDESSSSQGFRLVIRADTWRPLSSFSSSMCWLICRRTRSLYINQADNTKETLQIFINLHLFSHNKVNTEISKTIHNKLVWVKM